ncbi:MAG: hypothetical protein FH753_17755 [Firmicutes bacterium]|nr:hypothetical protein [Bacillota bacterium]
MEKKMIYYITQIKKALSSPKLNEIVNEPNMVVRLSGNKYATLFNIDHNKTLLNISFPSR